ncbi:MAG: dihydrofolate reductase [Propionibacteriaceae bacterium]|nr:dihydrofolate reductase [Propionibacteriaceae bacterium]
MKLTAIAAVAKNRVIGRDGGLPWNIPEDFAHFKQTTMGSTLIMGRTTFESIGKPLPGRISVVISHRPPPAEYSQFFEAATASATRLLWTHSLAQAFEAAAATGLPVFVCGGANIYEQAWPYLSDLDITELDADMSGDRFFPFIDPELWRETAREPKQGFSFVKYERHSIYPAS